jgi:hypothetical protein
MKVPDLKAALKGKGLPVSGKKSELIDRLKGESNEESDEIAEEDNTSKEVNYDDMKVPDLKAALKGKGLPVSGKKSELIDRLKGESK